MNHTATHTARLFSGPYAILATPFLPDKQVDYEQIARQADRLCATDLAGIVVCGSTSECALLSPQENKRVMTAAAEAIRGRKPLVCGATGPDLLTSAGYLAHMAALGAQGALVAPPYYFPYDGRAVLDFYRLLGEQNSGVPIVAYQIPAFTSPIPLAYMEELCSLPSVAALKNSSGNIKEIMRQLWIRDQARPDFSILTGTDDALLPCLAGGCDGSFTALAAVFPQTICSLYQAWEQGGLETARQLQSALLPLARLADQAPFPVGYKLLAVAAGTLETSFRQAMGEEVQSRMAGLLEQLRQQLAKRPLE